jgi:hypothetical protein
MNSGSVAVISILSVSLLFVIAGIVSASIALSKVAPESDRPSQIPLGPEQHIVSSETLVVLAMCKNEARIVIEWLQHYRREGVSHFFIIDNGSTDRTVDILRAQRDVTLIEDHAKHAQRELYNKYFNVYIKDAFDWVIVVDLDEFMYARNPQQTLLSILATTSDNVGSIVVPWKMFGSSGHIKHPPGRVVDNFTLRMAPKEPREVLCKCILRVKTVKEIDIHKSNLQDGYTHVNAAFLPYNEQGNAYINESDLLTHVLALNHYAIQSEEYFREVKMTRGAADQASSENVRDMRYFREYDHKDARDTELAEK